MSQVDMTERKRPRHKGGISGIELALHPVRPHPIEIVLDGLRIHQAPRMKDNASTKQLHWLSDFRRLREAPDPCQQHCWIKHAVASRRVFHEKFPWQESQHERLFFGGGRTDRKAAAATHHSMRDWNVGRSCRTSRNFDNNRWNSNLAQTRQRFQRYPQGILGSVLGQGTFGDAEFFESLDFVEQFEGIGLAAEQVLVGADRFGGVFGFVQ